jgi:hypothetical protein
MDRGVTALVLAQPSVALVSRVRQEIAAASASRTGNWWQWAGAGLAVAAALLAAFSVMQPSIRKQSPPISGALSNASQRPTVPPNLAKDRAIAPATNPVSASAYAYVVRPPRRMYAQAAAAARFAVLPSPKFEVIVPPGEREAVLRFAQAMREHSIGGTPLIAAANEEDTAPLALAPLSIPLLDESKESTGDATKVNAPIK